MENIKYVLEEIKRINELYSLSTEQIDKVFEEIPTAKVYTPVIGKFSSGKSALVNTFLGYSKRILKEDITPETAVPVELLYSEDNENVRLYFSDDKYSDITVDEYKKKEMDATSTKRVRLMLRNSFLEEIPDVMIVDMPGFESGFEIHNRAIDDYLPRSMAYIVAFPADDMIIRSSVGNILKELMLHEMPICVVITKYDKRNDEYEETLDKLKENLCRYIGNGAVTYCVTSSLEGDADQVKQFLAEVQEQSQAILARKFKKNVLSILDSTEGYLKTTLKSSKMNESELDEEEKRLSKDLESLNGRFSGEKENFDLQISSCVEDIKADVEMALKAEENTFVALAMNNQDINDHINTVVRNAVITSVNKRLIPKVEKYLKNVERCINKDGLGDVHLSFDLDTKKISKDMTGSIVAAVAGLLFSMPVLGAIVAGVLYVIGKSSAEKKREEQKNEIQLKLRTEVFPQILKEVGDGVEIEITKQMKMINASIEEEIHNQKDTLEKAVADVRQRMLNEKTEKEVLEKDININLAKIRDLREMIE